MVHDNKQEVSDHIARLLKKAKKEKEEEETVVIKVDPNEETQKLPAIKISNGQ